MGVFLFVDGLALVWGWVNFPILWPYTPVQPYNRTNKVEVPPPRAYVPKRILTWMLRVARGSLKAAVGDRVKHDYHFICIVFVVLSFFQPDSCVPLQAMLKSMPAHIGHCGPKPG